MNYKALLKDIIKKHGNHPKWDNCDFYKIKTISNTKVGAVGQEFLEATLKKLKYKYLFPKSKNNAPWDIEIQFVKFEIKTATEDTSGSFQFNHIRYKI